MTRLKRRAWPPTVCEDLVQSIAAEAAEASNDALDTRIDALIDENRRIHETLCFNLNPATNVMNPRAETALARGLGSRVSLGYPGDKYEMGLEAIERIEVIAAELAAEIFDADYAEIRVASGAMANLYAFMATTKPGDSIIVPPAEIGGHVTHHQAGAAGLYGLKIHPAPVSADGYTVDLNALAEQALTIRPALITIGGSLNLFEHPVREVRAIADSVGARLLFDAAHLCGVIAGKAWANPLSLGADLMSMSTYKSLGGPAGGLLLTNDAALAERIDGIAFPGLTANFDVGKAAALAISLLDWREYGQAYAAKMIDTARELAAALMVEGLPVFAASKGVTRSHQFALEAARFGGGQAAAKRLRRAGFLASGIGLPVSPIDGDMSGIRIGAPELVRWGVGPEHAPALARLIARGLTDAEPERVGAETARMRAGFQELHFMRKAPSRMAPLRKASS